MGEVDLRREDSDNATDFAYLMKQNNSFARPSRVFFISVHFFHVLGKSTTWNDHFSSFTENVNTRPPIWIFFPGFYTAPQIQFQGSSASFQKLNKFT